LLYISNMFRFFCFALACLFLAQMTVSAEPSAPDDADASSSVASIIADHVTDTTMTAMSPLLVVSAQGAWEYYHAESSARTSLPWYTSPWLWGSLLGLGGLFTLNTAIGNAVPLLKTPMNVVEEHENKITGLLIGLPMVLTRLFPDLEMPSTTKAASTLGDGILPIAMSSPWIAGMIAVPVVIACYLMVWLTFHSLHVIALVSPFGIVDTGLKFGRLGLVGIILLLSFVSPLLSVLLCAVIIALSYFIAGWSFRLLIFGTLLSWDLLLFRHRRRDPSNDLTARGFLCREVEAVPIRTYGTLTVRDDSTYAFHYRPWLIMPGQTIQLDSDAITIQRGILSPIARAHTANGPSNLVRFRPSLRNHEEALSQHLNAREIDDHIITKGFQQAREWLKEIYRPATTQAQTPIS
jgi:hypothetical protein